MENHDEDVLAHLLRRAEETAGTRESKLLQDLTVILQAAAAGHTMVLRCAWCERFEVEGEWVSLGAEEVKLGKLADAVTHGICIDCFRGIEPPPRSSHGED